MRLSAGLVRAIALVGMCNWLGLARALQPKATNSNDQLNAAFEGGPSYVSSRSVRFAAETDTEVEADGDAETEADSAGETTVTAAGDSAALSVSLTTTEMDKWKNLLTKDLDGLHQACVKDSTNNVAYGSIKSALSITATSDTTTKRKVVRSFSRVLPDSNSLETSGAKSTPELNYMVRLIGIGGDQAGHIYPQRLGGTADPLNFVPMSTNCNLKNSVWNNAEQHVDTTIRSALHNDCTTTWRVELNYCNRNPRFQYRPTDGTVLVTSALKGNSPGLTYKQNSDCAKHIAHVVTTNTAKLTFAYNNLAKTGAFSKVQRTFGFPTNGNALAFFNSPHSDDWAELARYFDGLLSRDVIGYDATKKSASAKLLRVWGVNVWSDKDNVQPQTADTNALIAARKLALHAYAKTLHTIASRNKKFDSKKKPVKFKVDKVGRVTYATLNDLGALSTDFRGEGRNPHASSSAITTYFGVTNDQAGHIWKNSFGGVDEPLNFVPMSPSCNMAGSVWNNMEQYSALQIDIDCTVTVKIEFAYADAAHPFRPSHGWYEVQSKGHSGCVPEQPKLFINWPHFETLQEHLNHFDALLNPNAPPFHTAMSAVTSPVVVNNNCAA